MKVRALRSHPYGGHSYRPGQEYEIKRTKDVNVLIAIKAVEIVPEPMRSSKALVVAPKKHVYREETKEMNSTPEPEGETKKKSSRGNRYSRKDLRAQEE